MGYQVLVYKFKDGDTFKIDKKELEDVLSKYGTIEVGVLYQ